MRFFAVSWWHVHGETREPRRGFGIKGKGKVNDMEAEGDEKTNGFQGPKICKLITPSTNSRSPAGATHPPTTFRGESEVRGWSQIGLVPSHIESNWRANGSIAINVHHRINFYGHERSE